MKNTYILMIVQALLALLLFFSEGYVRYTTIALFAIIDLILFVDLLTRKWSFEELLTLAAIFCSGLFMFFYISMQSDITTIFGVALMLLFLLIAMLDVISKPMNGSSNIPKIERLSLPQAPFQYDDVDMEYDLEYELQPTTLYQESMQFQQPVTSQSTSQLQKKPEPVMHIRHEKKLSDIKDKLAAKTVVYELEREARELRNAEKTLDNLKIYDTENSIYDTEKELVRESKLLENAQKQVDAMNKAARTALAESQLRKEASDLLKAQKKISALNAATKKIHAETQLRREASELLKAQKQMNSLNTVSNNAKAQSKLNKEVAEIKKAQKHIDDIQKIKELEKETKALKRADKQIKEVQFLNQQEKIVNQARDIAKAQKEIDKMNKNTKKSLAAQVSKQPKIKDAIIKTVKTKDDSFYFATENGNKFHEPGCLSIKKVPKNKLILYTSKKDAMKKCLQPCSVCIPK